MSGWERLARQLSAIIRQEKTMPRTPEEAQLALECLRLANGSFAVVNGADPVAEAERFYAFVTGTETGSARDKINAALDDAGVI